MPRGSDRRPAPMAKRPTARAPTANLRIFPPVFYSVVRPWRSTRAAVKLTPAKEGDGDDQFDLAPICPVSRRALFVATLPSPCMNMTFRCAASRAVAVATHRMTGSSIPTRQWAASSPGGVPPGRPTSARETALGRPGSPPPAGSPTPAAITQRDVSARDSHHSALRWAGGPSPHPPPPRRKPWPPRTRAAWTRSRARPRR